MLIYMPVYCQKEEGVYHMLCLLLFVINVSIGYVNRDRYIQRIIERRPCEFPVAKAMSRPRALELQLYFPALMFLEAVLQAS